jgi:hypothetical protein
MPAARGGDVKAASIVLRITERRAKMLGLDSAEPLSIVLERNRDLEGQLVADALGAALDAVDLTQEQRIAALSAAQATLAGEAPPDGSQPVYGPSVPSGPGGGTSALQRDVRAMLERDGIDVDELLAEVDGEDQEEGDDDGATGA